MAKYAVPALIAVIALLGGFYGGFRFGQTNASASSTGAGTGANANATPGAGRNICTTGGTGRGANANRASVFGQITNVAGNVLTIHNPTCNTDTKVTLSGNAVIRKSVDGTAADLTNGAYVTITGTKNSDGTISGNNANILPPGQTFGNGGGGAAPGGGAPGGGVPGGGGAPPAPGD